MTRPWRNFSKAQVETLAPTVSASGHPDLAPRCPHCGLESVRWYRYPNPYRVSSLISYVWCPACRHFHGSTVALVSKSELVDPLGGLTSEERLALEGDMAVSDPRRVLGSWPHSTDLDIEACALGDLATELHVRFTYIGAGQGNAYTQDIIEAIVDELRLPKS